MPNSNNSFSITTKSKAKYKFYCSNHFAFYFPKKFFFLFVIYTLKKLMSSVPFPPQKFVLALSCNFEFNK